MAEQRLSLRAGRYERLRHTLRFQLEDLEAEYADAVEELEPDDPAIAALEDETDELALLIWELDLAAPPHLREEFAECPPSRIAPCTR